MKPRLDLPVVTPRLLGPAGGRPAPPLRPEPWRREEESRSVFGHFLDAIKKRAHLLIEGRTVERSLPTIRAVTEQARLAAEYQEVLRTSFVKEAEQQLRLLEIEERRREIERSRSQASALGDLRLQRDRLSLQLEIARLRRDIRETRSRKPRPLSPTQQRTAKKAELEGRIEQLRRDEEAAVGRARGEPERRRLQNMYNQRRERLLEELEEYL